ncbi:twin-arginine translocase TatA/TatE family subunit [Leucobacter insecticola]|uniref:twin-arginine translocase TatA/TatE family subunit n=1 Tax=Leucobacter insecticola TaxID=2714934 RepID=UPI00244DE0AA|nr:twin-arginine translocase TatA/TatE family subunit [Leucobacter insecticola]
MNGPTLFVILFIVLLLFGAPKLPGLAKSLGQSMRILKKEVRSNDAEKPDAAADGTSDAEKPESDKK